MADNSEGDEISADRMFERNSEIGPKQKLRGLEFEDFDDDVAVADIISS